MKRVDNLISAVIPCFNQGQYLIEALVSILNQTYKHLEIIIVDDGSNDPATLDIMEKLDYPKTKVLKKENGGVSSARNYGIERSRGKFILTLDADDKFAPVFAQKGMDFLEKNPRVGMVTSYLFRFNSKGLGVKGYPKGGDVTSFLSQNNANASLLFRHQCWVDANGYDECIPGHADWEFNLNVTKHGWLVHSIPEHLFYYRDVEGSMFDIVSKKRPQIIKYMAEKHTELFKEHFIEIIYKKELELLKFKELESMYKNSLSLKVGNSLLNPIRWTKSALSNK